MQRRGVPTAQPPHRPEGIPPPGLGGKTRRSGTAKRRRRNPENFQHTPSKTAARAKTIARAAQTVEKSRKVRDGRSSLELLIVPGCLYGGCGRIESGGKFYFPEQNRFLAVFCARKSERFFAKNGRGGRGGGACSPVHPLAKNFFDNPQPPGRKQSSGRLPL